MGNVKMRAKAVEHKINEDAETDARKNNKISHQKCYHPEKAYNIIKPINTFLTKKQLSWFGHVQRSNDDNAEQSVLNTQTTDTAPEEDPS